jgi:hypothetical protein
VSESIDAKSWLAALVLGGIGLAIIAAPFVAGAHALWMAFAVTVGSVFLAGALGVLSPALPGEFPPLRRGG